MLNIIFDLNLVNLDVSTSSGTACNGGVESGYVTVMPPVLLYNHCNCGDEDIVMKMNLIC